MSSWNKDAKEQIIFSALKLCRCKQTDSIIINFESTFGFSESIDIDNMTLYIYILRFIFIFNLSRENIFAYLSWLSTLFFIQFLLHVEWE